MTLSSESDDEYPEPTVKSIPLNTSKSKIEVTPAPSKKVKFDKKEAISSPTTSSENQCPLCQESFEEVRDLINHCSTCEGKSPESQQSPNKSNPSVKRRPSVKNVEKVKPKESNETSRIKNAKLADKENIDPKPFDCKTCDRNFSDSAELRDHELKHWADSKLFPCTTCERIFVTKFSLTRHLRSSDHETEEKPR